MREIIRYGLIGCINTVVGYTGFLVALKWAYLSPLMANTISYILGLSTALVLNKIFVFKAEKFSYATIVRFLLAFMVAFGLNQATLFLCIRNTTIQIEVIQIFAMVMFSGTFYLLNKYIVFVPEKNGIIE